MTNIILTGFMGTGKSTVGRLLARELGLKFVDMDSLIEGESGMEIRDIFAQYGEARFREMEREAVRKLASGEFGAGLVVSTGGGAIVDPVNRSALKGWGLVVCLKASVEEILKRVGEKKDRPLLAAPDKRQAIETLMASRETAYADCHFTVDTTGRQVAEVASAIREFVDRLRQKSS